MRRDALIRDGIKLVILRDGDDHFLRLLVPGPERPTYVTPTLAVGADKLRDLVAEQTHRLDVAGLSVAVVAETVIVLYDGMSVTGPRRGLRNALIDIMRGQP